MKLLVELNFFSFSPFFALISRVFFADPYENSFIKSRMPYCISLTSILLSSSTSSGARKEGALAISSPHKRLLCNWFVLFVI
jgi:hypothetical protein